MAKQKGSHLMPLVRDPLLYSYLSQRIADTFPKEKIKIIMLKERATSVCFSLMVEERASRFFRLPPSVKRYRKLFRSVTNHTDTRGQQAV